MRTRDIAEHVHTWARLDSQPLDHCGPEWVAAVRAWQESAGYRYVQLCPETIRAGSYDVHLPRAMLSDGSSGPAPDQCPEAWFAHDRLYIYPVAIHRGRHVTVSRYRADAIYAVILIRRRLLLVAAASWVGLTIGGGVAWRAYRAAAAIVGPSTLLQASCLPHPYGWHLPSMDLSRAEWIGAR